MSENKKEYTIKQIADELGVTKSAISQKMTDEFRSKFTSKKKINNRITVVISEKGYEWLKEHDKKKNKCDEQKNDDVIKVLQEQLKEKDKQIEKLQILLNQSQQLQFKQNEKIEMLETKSKLHWWQKIFK